MKRATVIILTMLIAVIGLSLLYACPKVEEEPGTGIQAPGGQEVPLGTTATKAPTEAGQEAAPPAEEKAPEAGAEEKGAAEEGAGAGEEKGAGEEGKGGEAGPGEEGKGGEAGAGEQGAGEGKTGEGAGS